MAESKGAAKTAGTADKDAEFMSGPGKDHPNADYNDPGATGPAPMPVVYAAPDEAGSDDDDDSSSGSSSSSSSSSS